MSRHALTHTGLIKYNLGNIPETMIPERSKRLIRMSTIIPAAAQVLLILIILYLTIRVALHGTRHVGTTPCEPVSVIVPFRNEESNLRPLIESLSGQEYSGDIEVVLVDDCSTDNSRRVAQQVADELTDLSVTVIPTLPIADVKLTPKQHAMETGVRHASHQWLAFTDADMHLDRDWLQSLMASAGLTRSFVYGHTVLTSRARSAFHWFQAYQLEFLFSVAFAMHCAGLRGSCMGNNMLIAKRSYLSLGGQSGPGYCVAEDCALLNAAMRAGMNPVPTAPFIPTARAAPCSSLSQFANQTLRWLHGGLSSSWHLVAVILLFGAGNLLLLLSAAGILPILILHLGLATFACLWLFVIFLFARMKSPQSAVLFPLFLMFVVCETLCLAPMLLLRRRPSWKGRRI